MFTLAVHCKWGNWTFSSCSVTCGTGTKNGTREKDVEESNGGTCTGQFTETVSCKVADCPVRTSL